MRAGLAGMLVLSLWLPGFRLAGQEGGGVGRGEQLVRERKYAEARAGLEGVVRAEPRNAAAAYWLGRALIGLADVDGARAPLERAVELAPGNAEYHLYLGRVYCNQAGRASVFSKLGLAKKCRAQFEQAVAADPRNVDARLALMEYYAQAPGVAGGSKEKALEQAQAVRRLDPYRGGFAVAQHDAGAGRVEEASAGLRALAAAYPDSAGPVAQLAMLSLQRKQPEQAFAAVDAFLRRRPRDADGLYALGRTAAVSGQRLEDGERALRQYLAAPSASGPSAGSAHWRLGMILAARGRKDEALREYESAARLEPGNKEIRKSLEAARK